jgi:hypothetical protein
MKSKAVFDLDPANQPILAVRTEMTEDLRDKVACKFTDVLREFSNVAIVANKPSTPGVHEYDIIPLPLDDNYKIKELLYFVSFEQLVKLNIQLKWEIERREPIPEPSYKYTFLLQDAKHGKLLGHGINEKGEEELWFKDKIVTREEYGKIIEKIAEIKI